MSWQRPYSTKQDRHAYLIYKTGTVYWTHRRKKLRFLTLTGLKFSDKGHRKLLALFVRWIRKTYGKFQYFAVRTDEGKGVYHIVFVGSYMPKKALHDKWESIAGAWNTSISLVVDESYQGYEMTRQDQTMRYSRSRKWLPRGLIEHWEHFKPDVVAWNLFIENYDKQASMADYEQ